MLSTKILDMNVGELIGLMQSTSEIDDDTIMKLEDSLDNIQGTLLGNSYENIVDFTGNTEVEADKFEPEAEIDFEEEGFPSYSDVDSDKADQESVDNFEF